MRTTTGFLSVALALFGVQAQAGAHVPSGGTSPSLPPPPSSCTCPGKPPKHAVKALYLLDDLSPNNVIALPVGEDGLVDASWGKKYPTGGNGGAFLQKDGVTPVAVDSLNSQDAVVRVGHHLFVVNAGSNTISSFAIDPQDPLKLEMTEAPTQLTGEFPNTIAVSEELHMVCVGTAGAKNGVECFHATRGCLTPDGLGLRSFDLSDPTPPLFPAAAITDLFFSADLKFLYAPVRGSGSPGSHGFLSAFPIQNGKVAATDVRTVSTEVNALFGGFQSPWNQTEIFLADASFGAVVFNVANDGQATLVGKGETNPAVTATCWSEYSSVSDSVWLTSPVSPTLVEVRLDNAAQISQTNVTDGGQGLLDFVVPGEYLYALTIGSMNGTDAGIVVVDVSNGTPKTVQYTKIGFGANNYAHGLAAWTW